MNCHSHAYPDGPRIETAGEGIVTLAWLLRRLVKIEHYRDTCHEEEEKYHPELLYTTLSGECLPKEAGYTEKQRKHEITVVARIVLTQIVRQQRLVAKTRVIDKRYARYPVAGIKFSRLVEDIVLPPREIPHKITHVHVDQLIVEKVA